MCLTQWLLFLMVHSSDVSLIVPSALRRDCWADKYLVCPSKGILGTTCDGENLD
jgi:hypothetical protein